MIIHSATFAVFTILILCQDLMHIWLNSIVVFLVITQILLEIKLDLFCFYYNFTFSYFLTATSFQNWSHPMEMESIFGTCLVLIGRKMWAGRRSHTPTHPQHKTHRTQNTQDTLAANQYSCLCQQREMDLSHRHTPFTLENLWLL